MKLYNDGKILGVAYKTKTCEVYTLINPNRHDTLKSEIMFDLGHLPEGECGFYTANIPFMNRFVSMQYVNKYLKMNITDTELNSDHLW